MVATEDLTSISRMEFLLEHLIAKVTTTDSVLVNNHQPLKKKLLRDA